MFALHNYYTCLLALTEAIIIAMLQKKQIILSILFLFSEFKLIYVPLSPKCNKCSIKSTISYTNSNRDLIVTTAFNKVNNLVPFINSLRAFNKVCRVIIFTNDKTYELAKSILEFANCGIEFLIIPYNFDSRTDIWYYRWVLIGNYLIQNKDSIDNIIQIDLFDTIFQSDPFERFKRKNLFYLCYEDANIYELFHDDNWFKGEFKKTCDTLHDQCCSTINFTSLMMRMKLINGGMMAGNVTQFINFTNLMRKYGDENSRNGRGDDQHFLTFAIYLNHFHKYLNYEILNYSSDFMVAGSRYYMGHPERIDEQIFGNWSVDGKVPAIYHQFDRSYYYINQVKNQCHLIGKLSNHIEKK